MRRTSSHIGERMIGGGIRGCNVWNLDSGNHLQSDSPGKHVGIHNQPTPGRLDRNGTQLETIPSRKVAETIWRVTGPVGSDRITQRPGFALSPVGGTIPECGRIKTVASTDDHL